MMKLLLALLVTLPVYASYLPTTMNGESFTALESDAVKTGKGKFTFPQGDNLLVNGSFEHQTVAHGWTPVDVTVTASTTNVLDGKKKACLGSTGFVYQMLTDTDKYHGRKFIARINIENPDGRPADICLFDGSSPYQCQSVKETVFPEVFQEYVFQDTFISGKEYGLVINGLLDGICLDKASIELNKNEGFVANISNDYDWRDSPEFTVTGNTNYTVQELKTSRQGNTLHLRLVVKWTGTGNTNMIFITPPAGMTFNPGTAMGGGSATNSANSVEYPVVVGSNGSQLIVYKSGPVVSAFNTAGYQHYNWELPFTPTINSTLVLYTAIHVIGWSSRSKVINYPDETFSTDINPVYWKATACGENEIGCYNTYWYDRPSPSGILCTTRPSQPDAEIRTSGFYVEPSAFNADSNCNYPSAFRLVIGKGFSQPTRVLYSALNKAGAIGQQEYQEMGAMVTGFNTNGYDPVTGVLTFDAGLATEYSGLNTARQFIFNSSLQGFGYFVISATKNGGALVDERDKVKSSADNVRVESCYIANNGTASIGSSSCNGWIASASRLAAGTVNVLFKTGYWSQAPDCVIQAIGGAASFYHVYNSGSNLSATTAVIYSAPTNVLADTNFLLLCKGRG